MNNYEKPVKILEQKNTNTIYWYFQMHNCTQQSNFITRLQNKIRPKKSQNEKQQQLVSFDMTSFKIKLDPLTLPSCL